VERIDTSNTLEDRDSRTVLAMQLSQKTKDKDLKEFFSVVGDVRSVKMIQDRHSRRSKAIGIAYIEFKYSQSVPLALGLNGQQVNGIPIIVQQSQAEKNRHAQMVESAKQTLSKLGNGPIKLKVGRILKF
jgi:RNA-binding protein 39